MGLKGSSAEGLKSRFSPLGMWAFSIGTSIGWGSFIVTCNTYLQKSGILGTVFDLLIGMAVFLVIAWNLQYMIRTRPDAGGVYTFEKQVCGKDLGFLSFWFVLITYLAILWANMTSVPLFARFFLGKTFQFGFHYSIFGYEVWMGEALLSIFAVALVGFFCARSIRGVNIVMIIAAIVFAAGFAVCAVIAITGHDGSMSYNPMFLEGSSAFAQIVRIAAISPWAFIGFENISHFSEEYSFNVKKVRGILIWSVIITTILYLFVSILSVSAYPPEYDSWFSYIRDMGNLDGIKAVPAFYAAYHYLGQAGVTVLMLSLFAVILTSLIGNMLAVSRLLYAAGRDKEAPRSLAVLNKKGIPQNAVYAVVVVCLFIPFLGRTAIGWIVDVTTLGATLIYGLISYAVFRHARENGCRTEKATGIAGILLMMIFLVLLLIPGLLPFDAMATESYILFIVWSVIGLWYFRHLIIKTEKTLGEEQHIVVWVILLVLVLFASMMWVSRATENAANSAVERIYEYHQEHPTTGAEGEEDARAGYLQEQARNISRTNILYTVVSLGLFVLSTVIMMQNYHDARKLGKRLSVAEKNASTDLLTGVRNRTGFTHFQEELDSKIEDGTVDEFAVVVCDINDLKEANDTKGHLNGDRCIKEACAMICRVFLNSPVFRIGGDEFALILTGEDFSNRDELVRRLDEQSRKCQHDPGKSLAVGMSAFVPGEDSAVLDVFMRADHIMYTNKSNMKVNSVRS